MVSYFFCHPAASRSWGLEFIYVISYRHHGRASEATAEQRVCVIRIVL